jgi:predicted alpha/beta hydrolase family esterase
LNIKDLDVPIIIAHSPNDEMIGYHHAKLLLKYCKNGIHWILQGGHNNNNLDDPKYIKILESFI